MFFRIVLLLSVWWRKSLEDLSDNNVKHSKAGVSQTPLTYSIASHTLAVRASLQFLLHYTLSAILLALGIDTNTIETCRSNKLTHSASDVEFESGGRAPKVEMVLER